MAITEANQELSAAELQDLITDKLHRSGIKEKLQALGPRDVVRALHLERPNAAFLLKDSEPTPVSAVLSVQSCMLFRLLEALSTFNDKPTLEKQMENFKSIELAKAKLEERTLFQAELQRQRAEFEQKLVSAHAKSAEVIQEERTRLSEREREMDKQYLLLKQQMLDEHNNTIIKEKQLRNESELAAKQLEMERNQLRRRVEEVQLQLDKVSEFKDKYTQKMEASMSQYKIDLTKEYSSLLSTVEIERTKLQGERLVLNEKEALVERMLAGASKTEEEAAKAKMELQDALTRLEETTKSRDNILSQMNELQLQVLTQKGGASLEFEITSLKRQLVSAEKAAEQRQQDYEILIKSITAPKDESVEELAESRQNELRWKQKCQELVTKLENEFANSDELGRQLDRERLRNKELERELADTRLLLHQSQTALKIAQTASTADFVPYQSQRSPYTSHSPDRQSDPLYERYSQIVRDHSSGSIQKIPLPEQYDSYSASPPKPATTAWRDDFLTPSEKALLKASRLKQHATPPREAQAGHGREVERPSGTPLLSKLPKRASLPSESLLPTAPPVPPPAVSATAPPAAALEATDKEATGKEATESTSVKAQEAELLRLAEERKAAEALRNQRAEEERLRRASEEADRLKVLEQERIEAEARAKKLEEERLAQAQREKEIEKKAQLEKQRLDELQKEKERVAAEEKKKAEAMQGVLALEQDPVMQKYMAMVKEKRGEPE
ncbi:hypothetical protein HDU91_000560, partial [Kappamyces sp. JEL0680]